MIRSIYGLTQFTDTIHATTASPGSADYCKVADDRILHHRVAEELVAAAGRERFDPFDRVTDVGHIDLIVFHSGTASESIRSSRYGLMPPSTTTSTLRPSNSRSSCC